MFLHGIICEMDKFILQVCGIEFLGTRANISFLVPVALHVAIDGGDHHEASEIEFSLFE